LPLTLSLSLSHTHSHSLLKINSFSYGALFLDKGFSLRASYLIGPTGVLRHVTMNEPPVGRSVDEALRVVQAFKQFDEVGEV
jgi:peroxiredoxin (alkyl hydroperoxide reductase subunit C)